MARIRSVKPDFFRHEVLQDLEIGNPGSYPMMVFAGLWGHCDSKGRFEWRPRQLKLDILPFLPFDMAATLEILERSGMVKRYSVDGKDYGEVPTFVKHQRLSGKESTEGEKHPEPIREAKGKQQGSGGEIQESQEGKGMEEEGKDSFVASKLTTPICPQKEIISLYAESLPELPQPRVWEGAREKNLTARWRWVLADLKARDKPHDRDAGLDFFKRMFGYIRESDFLMGRAGTWSADLGWIVKAEPFAKIIQGNYENKEKAA